MWPPGCSASSRYNLNCPRPPQLLHIFLALIVAACMGPCLEGALNSEVLTEKKADCLAEGCPGAPRMEVEVELLPASAAGTEQKDATLKQYTHNKNVSKSQQEDIPEVKMTYAEQFDHWKTRVIIVCTVVAAVEILIVVFIVAYWREIRWHLRKISCPCDTYSRTGHEALERRRPTSVDTQSDDLEVIEVRSQGHEVHTYSVRDDLDIRPEEEQALETSSV